METLFGIVLLLLIIIGAYGKAKKKRKKPQKTRKTHELHKNEISGKAYQLLESIELIESSKNPDIVIGRYIFSRELSKRLEQVSNTNKYNRQFYEAIESYKTDYYDRNITGAQIYFLENPGDNEKWEAFYIKHLIRSINAQYEKHMIETRGMVQKKAVLKRYDKLWELETMVSKEIYNRGDSEIKSLAINDLKELRQLITKEQKKYTS